MASQVGYPIKIDQHTLKLAQGRFARVYVEIDLFKPVVGMISVEEKWYKVEYEGLHIICSNCGCYGHYSRDCSKSEVVLGDSNSTNKVNDATLNEVVVVPSGVPFEPLPT